jgi:hypothetical protein
MIAESCPRALEERAAMRITARSHTCNGAVEFVFHIAVAAGQNLGCVDGRDQHNRASKAGKGGKGRCSFIAATGKALKAFQLAYCLLYPRSQRSFFGKNRAALLRVRLARDHRRNPARPGRCPIGSAIIPFVGNRDPQRHVWSEIE